MKQYKYETEFIDKFGNTSSMEVISTRKLCFRELSEIYTKKERKLLSMKCLP